MSTGKLAAVALAAGAIAAGFFYPPVRLFAEKAVGRGTGCPLGQALEADRNIKRQIRINGEIVRASRLLEKDPACGRGTRRRAGSAWRPRTATCGRMYCSSGKGPVMRSGSRPPRTD